MENVTSILTRREFLGILSGLVLLQSCQIQIPVGVSPFLRGPFPVGRAILGVTPGTAAMPMPTSIPPISTATCNDHFSGPGTTVKSIVYYPAAYSAAPGIQMNPGHPTYRTEFPVMLYAHARRDPICTDQLPAGADPALLDITQDYTRIGRILDHVASHGCVCVAPDLSGLTFFNEFNERAEVLVALHGYLTSLNASLFMNRLDLRHIVLAGHSMGGGACLLARSRIATGGTRVVAMGVLAPAVDQTVAPLAAVQPPAPGLGLLVVGGTVDTTGKPKIVYDNAIAPRILVTIPGANHFGYTDVCSLDNQICVDAFDHPGSISALGQQLTAAAYLAALVRVFALGDITAEPYLAGQPIPELDFVGVSNVAVQQDGF